MSKSIKALLASTNPWAMGLARVMLGLMWLISLRWKLPPDFEASGETTGLRTWLEREAEQPAFGFYGDIIDSLVLPNFTLFAWLIFLAELVVGLGLLTGFMLRPAAFGGLLLSFNLWLGLKGVDGEWHWTYVLMMVWHAAILLSPASSTWSVTDRLSGALAEMGTIGSSPWHRVSGGGAGGTAEKGSLGAAVLRSGLGLITLVTWWGNVDKDFYDGANFPGFFEWVSRPVEEGGNGATLGFVHSIIDNTILQAPEFFGWVMTFLELLIAVGLLLGVFTRAASLAATGFFGSLFLVYFGGEEWIFIYVMLTMAAAVTFLVWGGRKYGADEAIAKVRGESPASLIW